MLNSEESVKAIEDLGLLEEDLVLKLNTPLDTLTHYLSKKLCYDQNERDLVILRHDVGILWPDNRRENRGINLVLYGEPQGYSAMARTVGYPTAIAVKMILDGIVLLFPVYSKKCFFVRYYISNNKNYIWYLLSLLT